MQHLRRFTFLMLLSGVIVLAGCGSAMPAPTANPVTKVSIQLGWIHEYSTAEFYTAQKNGRFAAQNLDVDMQEGGFIDGKYVDAVTEVLAGKADFGLSSDYSLIQNRADGKPLVAIAAITQHSPVAIIALAKSNIRRPQDLIGHKVAVADGGSLMLYNALLSSQGIDQSKVTTISRKDFGIDPLIKGDVDAIVGWIINEGVQVKQAGYEPSYILMSDYGIDSYNTVLFTTDHMIKDKPQVVQKFLNAVVQGINDVVSNPEQAVDYTLTYGKNLKKDDQTLRLQALLPLINPAGSKPGMMDDATWTTISQIATDQKLLTKPISVTSVYTLTFLKQLYQ
jgi:NitT/TauT family transport system substrate-binding protein